MKKLICLLLCAIFIFSYSAVDVNAETAYDFIRVKLSTNNATSLSIGVSGSYEIEGKQIDFDGGTLNVSISSGKVRLVHSSLGEIAKASKVGIIRKNLPRENGYLKLNSKKYLGHFYITVNSYGKLQVVNKVPLDHYLYGVVGHEMSDSFPIEALKAQTVASKCYALTSINPSADYDVTDTSAYQVYCGYNAEYTRVIAAVDATINDILTVDGRLMKTYYSASNGGETNLPSYTWSSTASNAGYDVRFDEYDMSNPASPVEKVTIPIGEGVSLSTALNRLLTAQAEAKLGEEIDGIKAISSARMHTPAFELTQRNLTKCTVDMTVKKASGETADVSVTFSANEFKNYGLVTNGSLRIYWGEESDGGYVIYHCRYGHGVGLSQRGAQQRAAMGQSYDEILAFYYPGMTLEKVSILDPEHPDPTPTATVQPTEAPTAAPTTAPVTPSPKPTATQDPGETVWAYGVVTGNCVNLRSGPSTDYEIVDIVYKGDRLTIYEQMETGWYRVTAENGNSGYISNKYVEITSYGQGTTTPAPTVKPTETPAPTPTATPAPDETVYIGIITKNGVNFRTGPSTSYSSMGKLNANDGLIIYEKIGEWYRVEHDGKMGYVHGDYVKITGVYDGNELPDGAIGKGVTIARVNLRKGPSTSHEIIQLLPKGAEVIIYGQENGWYKASYNGKTGYLTQSYVEVTYTSDDGGGSGGGTSDEPIAQGVTNARVNFRTKPSTTAPKIALLPAGTRVTLYSLDNGWYEAEYSGTRGYLYAKYVSIVEDAEPSAAGIEPAQGETTGKLNIRVKPNTSAEIIVQLPRNTAVQVLGECGDWYYIKSGNNAGYVSKAYMRIVSAGSMQIAKVSDSCSAVSAKTAAKVNMRTAPSTGNSDIIRLLPSGESITVYYIVNGWCLINHDGDWGFVVADYVRK